MGDCLAATGGEKLIFSHFLLFTGWPLGGGGWWCGHGQGAWVRFQVWRGSTLSYWHRGYILIQGRHPDTGLISEPSTGNFLINPRATGKLSAAVCLQLEWEYLKSSNSTSNYNHINVALSLVWGNNPILEVDHLPLQLGGCWDLELELHFCDRLDETCFDYVWHACDTHAALGVLPSQLEGEWVSIYCNNFIYLNLPYPYHPLHGLSLLAAKNYSLKHWASGKKVCYGNFPIYLCVFIWNLRARSRVEQRSSGGKV